MPFPGTLNFPDLLVGDTWGGITVGPVSIQEGETEVPPSFPLASCRLYFRDSRTNSLGYGFKSEVAEGYGLIDITDAATWSVTIDPVILPLPAGKWLYDFEFTDTEGTVITLLKGYQKLIQDISTNG